MKSEYGAFGIVLLVWKYNSDQDTVHEYIAIFIVQQRIKKYEIRNDSFESNGFEKQQRNRKD